MKRGTIYIHRVCLVLGLCLMGFAVGCRSTQGDGALRAERIEQKIERAKAVLNNPNSTPAERAKASELLTEVAKDSRALGSDKDSETNRANSNASAASKWRWAVGIGASLVVAYFLNRRK
jgi:hypothetical protein